MLRHIDAIDCDWVKNPSLLTASPTAWERPRRSKEREEGRNGAAPGFLAWQCIGCGRIEGPQPCIRVCQERKVSFVYASDHAAVLSRLLNAEERIAALESLVRRMALSTPRDGEWERGYRSLQEEARRVLKVAHGPRSIDRTPAQETLEEP